MRFRSGVKHWNSPMPSKPMRQRHESPRTGDNKGAIRRAKGGALDGNVNVMAGVLWLAHWTRPGPNGYTRVHTGHGTRKMTWREMARPGSKWGVAGIRSWRRPNGESPLTQGEAVEYAAQVGAVIIQEAKSPLMGKNQRWFDQAVEACKKADHPAWFKTLYNMKAPRGKTLFCQRAGGQMALIFGKKVRGRARRVAFARRITKHWGTVRPNATW